MQGQDVSGVSWPCVIVNSVNVDMPFLYDLARLADRSTYDVILLFQYINYSSERRS